jgi:hypothetical protein
MVKGNLKMNYTVKVCTDYVIKDPKKTQEILERVSHIISNSYRRAQQQEG